MSFERPIGPGAEPPPVPAGAGQAPSADASVITPAMRLQILSTEHWSLLASRSLAWNESFSRAGMFLSTLAGSIVALALVAQADNFGEGFRIFALVILPVVLLVGIGTNLRMGISNYHDAMCVIGMNRIRAAYVGIAPDLGRYFVMGTTDDQRGVSLTMATQPETPLLVQMLASTPLLVTILNGVLAAAIIALLVIQLGGANGVAIALGIVGFAGTIAGFTWYARRDIARAIEEYKPLFPGPPETSP
ncbi:MAG TPA: hypothetical protein VFW95_13555 [Candidatus Limnocylindria bacterium]|nr:hypothetical protein [Candidatus Limnocylindria bacterium]